MADPGSLGQVAAQNRYGWPPRPFDPLPEDDCAPLVEEDPILGEETDCTCERQPLDVPADLGQRLGRVGVVDPLDLLLDDGALVEVGGHEVRGGADDRAWRP